MPLPPPVRLGLLAALAALLAGGAARAADVQFDAIAQNTQASTRTLRIPATGTFNPAANARFLTVGVGISDANHRVTSVIWFRVNAMGGIQISELVQPVIARDSDLTSSTCRTELFARATMGGPGYAVVTVVANSGSPPAPSLAGTVMSFANVAGTWIDPPCCSNASNQGSGTTAATKTLFGVAKGDIAVSAVCTTWTGTAPGTPMPDAAINPEMVPRAFLTGPGTAKLQHYTGTSPGSPLFVRPMTSSRHLRWLQSGSRGWAIAALALIADDVPNPPGPDAGGALDAAGTGGAGAGTGGAGPAATGGSGAGGSGPGGIGGVDMGAPVDLGGGASGTGGGAGTVGGATGDAGPGGAAGGNAAGGGPALPMVEEDGGVNSTAPVDWRVGCACELGGARGTPASLALSLLGLALLVLRRAHRRR